MADLGAENFVGIIDFNFTEDPAENNAIIVLSESVLNLKAIFHVLVFKE